MTEHLVPISNPIYAPPINNNSDLFGCQPSINTEYNHSSWPGTEYPYTAQDHLALRRTAHKNFIRPRTLDGVTVHKPVDEEAYSCNCNLDNSPWNSKMNSEALKYEVKSGVLKRGCDCLKRNGLQDQCPRIRHEGRWQRGGSGEVLPPRSYYTDHIQRRSRPQNNTCEAVTSRQHGAETLAGSYPCEALLICKRANEKSVNEKC
ncbi:uncharacterized protein LOC124352765 [Homalodisca vitripennis]|uniref:uncharacterized protein LOC124352765 n=1 Tax=Homalodisca vitripennis TaxID=197043 RepID=UPI001EECDB46|nr:uncharacterized protein LOC124352765 [Homalodisca vitripennis]KAG8318588.1 hypothetical protein J6590_001707 [Homalodisca vitripennis]